MPFLNIFLIQVTKWITYNFITGFYDHFLSVLLNLQLFLQIATANILQLQ